MGELIQYKQEHACVSGSEDFEEEIKTLWICGEIFEGINNESSPKNAH